MQDCWMVPDDQHLRLKPPAHPQNSAAHAAAMHTTPDATTSDRPPAWEIPLGGVGGEM